MRVWRRSPTVIEIPEGSSHEVVLRLWRLGSKEQALQDGWVRIGLHRLRGEPIIVVESQSQESAQESFRWIIKEKKVWPAKLFLCVVDERIDQVLEGQEIKVFYEHGRTTQSSAAKWRQR